MQWPKFHHDNFSPSRDIKQNMLLRSYLDIINFKIYLGSSSQAMVDMWRKREEDGNTKKELFR